ncbi:MAG TPA: methyltransferase domain-containing protein [Dongiaceae bacterium]|jgi:SAM-dependent methyltransferase|nr:methyltransferase domain-containing protein [Dongiaceae bacterium]
MSSPDWEMLYQAGETRWEKGAPAPGLVDFLAQHSQLPGATVCVPGCGFGNDVRAWAQAGFRAYGYDLAPSAIRWSAERTAAAGLEAAFRLADFLRDPAPFPFDWLFEHTLFCAIPLADRDQYVTAVRRWLKPGGNYLAINYMICEPEGPPFATTREELRSRFTPHFDLVAEWEPRSFPNRAGRERMFWWRVRA